MASDANQGVPSTGPRGKLDSKDLPVLRRLGRGSSGFIYETTWSGNRYIRKDFPLGLVEHKCAFEKGVQPLFNLNHPNLVKCFGYAVGKGFCSLVQEYVDGNLQSFRQRRIEAKRWTDMESSSKLDVSKIRRLLSGKVSNRGTAGSSEPGSSTTSPRQSDGPSPLDLHEAVQAMLEIATGMKYLHDNQVVHGELKPKNVLLCSEADEWKVKVADYGLVDTRKRIKLDSKRSRHLEVLTWKAPERLEELLGPLTEDSDDPFTDSDTDSDECDESDDSDDFLKSRLAMADVYSFGLTCAYIFGGKLLFPDLSLTELWKQRWKDFRPELPSDCPANARALIYSCLQFEPLSRPTFSDIRAVLLLMSVLPRLISMGLMKGKVQPKWKKGKKKKKKKKKKKNRKKGRRQELTTHNIVQCHLYLLESYKMQYFSGCKHGKVDQKSA
ncbi:hypothetical protein M758_3G178100 [Ceratodon purpureus]|nr:hypothetical protein M758_3G178100 [Ceratodon purpureus]